MLSLARLKQHLRIDHNDEDALLLGYKQSALSLFELQTGRTLTEPPNTLQGQPENALLLTPAIAQGALLLIGHWYAQRETASERSQQEIPFSTRALWQPYLWAKF